MKDKMLNVKLNFIKNSCKREGIIDIGSANNHLELYLLTKDHVFSKFGTKTDFFKLCGEYDFYFAIPNAVQSCKNFHGFNEDEFNYFVTTYLESIGAL